MSLQYAELVVSVARKTDAQLWPSLFAAVGSPAALGEGLRCAGDLQVWRLHAFLSESCAVDCSIELLLGEVSVQTLC